MDFPNPSKAAGSFVESIKDKLNFGSRNADKDDYAQEEYDYEDYAYDPNFDDYGEYGYDESYAVDSYGDSYSDTYTTRDPYRTRPARLVSLDDIKSTTSAYGVMTPEQRGIIACLPRRRSLDISPIRRIPVLARAQAVA